MAVELDFDNSNNWELKWASSYQVQRVSENEYVPIPEIEIPVEFNSNILVVTIATENNPGYWRRAGYLLQKTSASLTGSDLSTLTKKSKLWLNKNNLITLINANGFQVSISVPFWFEEVSFSIYQYIGLETTPEAQALQYVAVSLILGII